MNMPNIGLCDYYVNEIIGLGCKISFNARFGPFSLAVDKLKSVNLVTKNYDILDT